jgi:hypothetical protein
MQDVAVGEAVVGARGGEDVEERRAVRLGFGLRLEEERRRARGLRADDVGKFLGPVNE